MVGVTLAGTEVTLESREGECLTSTLHRAGFLMRWACLRGGCGLCRVSVESGEIRYDAMIAESVLTAQTGVLACRAVPISDVTISVPEEGNLRCVAPSITRYALRT